MILCQCRIFTMNIDWHILHRIVNNDHRYCFWYLTNLIRNYHLFYSSICNHFWSVHFRHIYNTNMTLVHSFDLKMVHWYWRNDILLRTNVVRISLIHMQLTTLYLPYSQWNPTTTFAFYFKSPNDDEQVQRLLPVIGIIFHIKFFILKTKMQKQYNDRKFIFLW